MSWVLAWSVLTAAPIAGAQPPGDPDERGREIFDAGVEAFGNAEYEVALDRFRQAYALSGRAELLYNVGLAVAGATGIALGAFGIASSECLVRDAEGCLEARETNWGAVALYGGLGIAALGGAIVWLIVALASDSNGEDVAWTDAWSF